MADANEDTENPNESIIKFYRYQPAESDRIAGLSSNKIWVSDPLSFNDPVDTRKPIKNSIYRSPFDLTAIKEAVKYLFSGKTKNDFSSYFSSRCIELIEHWVNPENNDLAIYDLIDAIDEHYKTLGIICLSPNFDSQIMWSHYASQHHGFIIEYSLDLLSFDFERNFSIENVVYTNAKPHMCISEFLLTPHLAYKRLLATKHTEWAYEREVRLIHKTKNGQFVDMPQGLKISALIAGPKTSSENMKLIKEKAKAMNVNFTGVENNGYEIVINPFAFVNIS